MVVNLFCRLTFVSSLFSPVFSLRNHNPSEGHKTRTDHQDFKWCNGLEIELLYRSEGKLHFTSWLANTFCKYFFIWNNLTRKRTHTLWDNNYVKGPIIRPKSKFSIFTMFVSHAKYRITIKMCYGHYTLQHTF